MPQEQVQCIFCQIIAGSVPSRKVFEDDKVLAVLDINPANPGHVLVLPKEHATVLPQLADDVAERVGVVAKRLGMAVLSLFRQMGCQGTTLLAANGPAAGQRAGHALLHVIPRFLQDGIGLMVAHGAPSKEHAEFHAMLARAAAKAFGYPENEFLKDAKPPAEGAPAPKPAPKPAPQGGNLDDITAFLAGGKK